MTKKRLFFCVIIPALLLPLLLLSLTACGGTSGANDEINLTFLRLANDEAEAVFWAEVIESYQELHPNVKIEYDDAAIGDDMDVKLTSLFAANAGPDIIGHGIMSIASRVEAGQYTSISEYFDGWEGKDDIFPACGTRHVQQ